jgi:hypothetical protein
MKSAVPALVLVASLPAALAAYDNSPSHIVVFPECTWAAATGGGTWVPELQITNHMGSDFFVDAYYFTGINGRFVFLVPTLWEGFTVKFTNVLASMQALDFGFTYYGTSGCLLLSTQDTSLKISAVMRISNGNYGKTFPGLCFVDSNSANVSRTMMIPNIMQSSDYRTLTGFCNGTGTWGDMTVRFWIVGEDGGVVGNSWDETFMQWEYKVFNPFAKAGLPPGTYTNHWLFIAPRTSANSELGSCGLFCFGSIANNTTNDTYALIATQWR